MQTEITANARQAAFYFRHAAKTENNQIVVSIDPGDQRAGKEQSNLLRDLFGNPYRPIAFDKSLLTWNGGTIIHLAQVAGASGQG